MTQSQAEIVDKFDKTIDAAGIANHLAKAKLLKPQGKPLIRMIIFYIILPLLNCLVALTPTRKAFVKATKRLRKAFACVQGSTYERFSNVPAAQ